MDSSSIVSSHLVVFLSPGTFVDESSSKRIESWDPAQACEMAAGIVERYGAKPYAFYFTTSLTHPDIPDGVGGFLAVESRQIERSGTYFLGGTPLTVDDVIARRSEKDAILISNMRNNSPVVVESRNGFLSVHPFEARDAIVDASGAVAVRGDAPAYVALRSRLD